MLARTVFTSASPEWQRFRGAEYRGLATHDPLEQALVACVLSRAPLGARLAPSVRLYIARLACSGAFPSRAPPLLRLVCKTDADCARLVRAARLSRQLRRLFDCIPRECSLWTLYHTWTYEVARSMHCVPVHRTMPLGADPCAAKLSRANRLHIRSFARLTVMHAREGARPAYFPTAALMHSWAARLGAESSRDAFFRAGVELADHRARAAVLVEHEVLRGNAITYDRAEGCTALAEEHVKRTVFFYKRLYLASLQRSLLDLAARLYVQLSALGLNAAERDYFYMLSAAEHDDPPAPA